LRSNHSANNTENTSYQNISVGKIKTLKQTTLMKMRKWLWGIQVNIML